MSTMRARERETWRVDHLPPSPTTTPHLNQQSIDGDDGHEATGKTSELIPSLPPPHTHLNQQPVDEDDEHDAGQDEERVEHLGGAVEGGGAQSITIGRPSATLWARREAAEWREAVLGPLVSRPPTAAFMARRRWQ